MSKAKRLYNPKSGYGLMEAAWRGTHKGIITLAQLVEVLVAAGKTPAAAKASTTVMISPRADDGTCRGNPLGNRSAKGTAYFAMPLKGGKFRWMNRKVELAPYPARAKKEVKATKAKTTTKVKATKAKAKKATSKNGKAKSKAKKKATATA